MKGKWKSDGTKSIQHTIMMTMIIANLQEQHLDQTRQPLLICQPFLSQQ